MSLLKFTVENYDDVFVLRVHAPDGWSASTYYTTASMVRSIQVQHANGVSHEVYTRWLNTYIRHLYLNGSPNPEHGEKVCKLPNFVKEIIVADAEQPSQMGHDAIVKYQRLTGDRVPGFQGA